MWTCNSVCEQQNTVHQSETHTHQSGWRTLCDRDHTSVRCSPALCISSVLVTGSPVYRALRGSNRVSKLFIIIMDPVPPAQFIRRVKLNSSFMLTLLAVTHQQLFLVMWSVRGDRNMGRNSVTFIFIRNRLIMGNILLENRYAIMWCGLLAASKNTEYMYPYSEQTKVVINLMWKYGALLILFVKKRKNRKRRDK